MTERLGAGQLSALAAAIAIALAVAASAQDAPANTIGRRPKGVLTGALDAAECGASAIGY
jgi:hypothetical protein